MRTDTPRVRELFARLVGRWWHRARRWLRGGGAATVPWDGRRWRHPQPREPVVAIGDVQGDLEALDAILRAESLVDRAGRWCGGARHLVLLGDLVGGHADARLCVEFVRRLEREALRSGGRVHALLGNHDVLPARGEIDGWSAAERRAFADPPVAGAQGPGAETAFRGDSELARWLRSRNALLQIGTTLFVHAGIDEWFADSEPGDVNATVRRWLAHWQGRAPAPPAATRWAVGVPGMDRHDALARGPLWHRGFGADGPREARLRPRRKHVAAWLAARGIRRIVVGHAPTDDARIELEHPVYGDLVVRIDTRIGDREHGRLSALVLAPDPEAHDHRHRWRDARCRRRELRLLARRAAPALTGANRAP